MIARKSSGIRWTLGKLLPSQISRMRLPDLRIIYTNYPISQRAFRLEWRNLINVRETYQLFYGEYISGNSR